VAEAGLTLLAAFGGFAEAAATVLARGAEPPEPHAPVAVPVLADSSPG
jgi:hypothetical protein